MSLAMKARQKVKRKGAAKDRVFGCDLLEHLQHSGQEVPQVLRSCTEFVEQHGIVDGIYRLSGVSSNIQKLRQEFDSDRCPDLNKDVYLQDIHCVSSLCKAYFRELPNPLLTYQLYDKFADAVAIQMEEGRLVKIKEVLKELPSPHYRTLEFLMRHLVHIASYSSQTNMHARNLAIVWAPNLLRSKDIEASGFNGTAAFMEVRVQSIVVEFILTHVEQLFRDAPLSGSDRESLRKSLLLSSLGLPGVHPDCQTMSYNLPAMLNQGDGPPQIRPYHTIIELNDHKRKGSLKVKKWRSIFNLGRSSTDSKRKLAKAEEKDDRSVKMSLRPAKSMDSLSSVPDTNDDNTGLGRKKSQKQAPQRRESFDSPSSREESCLESDEYPDGKFKSEEGQQTLESEGEASAKSEPTTPKAGRASLVGGAPQGRSPKTARNRAEKCAGVHISVPFSVTVPFHITSNISLSRLTRGLECPALSYSSSDKEALERSSKELEAEEQLGAKIPIAEEDHMDTKPASALDSEENRLSLEVQDSFSFLDNQDTWQDCSTEGDQPEKSLLEETTSDFAGEMLDGFQGMDDDMESRFMNLEFSVEPPLEYLSIEECMNEEQYYMATSCFDTEELSKETDSEDPFLRAYNDLSPLAPDLEKLRQLSAPHGWDMPLPESVLGGEMAQEMLSNQPPRPAEGPLPSNTNGSSSSKEGSSTKVPLPDGPHASELARPRRSKEAAEDPHGALRQPEGLEGDGVEGTAAEPSPAGQREEDKKVTGGDGLEAGPGPPRTEPTTDVAPVGEHQGTWALESEGHAARASHAGDEQGQAPRQREAELAPCAQGQEANGRAPEEVRVQEGQGDSAPPMPETKQPENGKAPSQPLAMKITPALPPESGLELPAVPICESGPMSTTPFLETGLETTAAPLDQNGPQASISLLGIGHEAPTTPGYESGPEAAPLLETSSDLASRSDTSPSLGSGPTSLPLESGPLNPTDLPALPEPDMLAGVRPDGSAPMRVTSSTVRVQQVKSVPIVPPKPQFARMPPTVNMHLGEASTWPKLSASEKSSGGGETGLGKGASLQRQSHPVSLGGCCRVAEGMESNEESPPSGALEKCPSSTESREPAKTSLQKQRQASWRNGGSMSFDTAVALAKERHLAQAPVRRMQTYCVGDGREMHGAPKVEKPPPFPRPALKPVGQCSLRPLSCTGALLSPDALGKHPPLPDTACEPHLVPGQEPLPFAQVPAARSRLSMPRLGQQPSDTEEAAGPLPQQRRSLAFEIRDCGGSEEL
ncbi:rho GTPase-activating protein 30 isoform X2 [Dermochelys coriacea]|uniref:rho GTPase-activating protein 30 isoform X2 n=1 Tax=Dermochelys coriacea TaxID=27794 RepID=UPI0018E806CF|nr:rho GTPase-activating protein 30 isoform X2 [Dermochelys coriacea]